MARMIRLARTLSLTLPAAALALSGCGPSGNDPGPGGVTVSEAQALDEAAEMIEQRRLPEGALETPGPTPSPSATPATER